MDMTQISQMIDSKVTDGRKQTVAELAELVKMLWNNGAFRRMTYSEFSTLPVINGKANEYIEDLTYHPKYCITRCKELRKKKPKYNSYYKYATIWFANFETDQTGDIHHPYA